MIAFPLRKQRSKTAGFSLVEMLSVVGVIGVISAVAIPSVTSTNDASRLAATKRNAQNVVSVYQSAQSAGLIFLDENNDLEKTIENVVQGGLVPDGVFEGTYFGLPELSGDEIKLVMNYIDFRNNGLEYFSEQIEQRQQLINAPTASVAAGYASPPVTLVASPIEAFGILAEPDEVISSGGYVLTAGSTPGVGPTLTFSIHE